MKKILLLHNDKDILKGIKFILVSYGFEVRIHSSALNVLEVVVGYRPDLILLDERLGERIHTEIYKDLKCVYSTVPIMLFSADKEMRRYLDIFGPDVFIRESFDVKNLINTSNLCKN